MSADWTRKVRPGDPLRISARAYNAFVDSAVAHMGRDVLAEAPGTPDSATHVLARNEGTTTVEAFTPVRISSTDSAVLSRRNRKIVLAFGGAVSTTPLSEPGIMVLQEPIRRGTVGKAVIAGATLCKVGALPSGAAPPSGTRLGMATGLLRIDGDGSATLVGSVSVIDGSTFLAVVRIDGGGGTFYAKINGSPEQIGTAARWLYSFTEVRWQESSTTFVDVTLGRTDAAYGRAVNLLEVGNTASSAYSIPVAGTNFAIGNTGVLFRPVPVGAVVRMTLAPDSTAELVPTFSAPNPVWGPCTPLAGLVGSDESYGAAPVPEGSEPSEGTP